MTDADRYTANWARREDLPALAQLAARTFPLACPPHIAAKDIAEFVAQNLSEQAFATYLADPTRHLWLLRSVTEPIRLVGYAMSRTAPVDDPQLQEVLPQGQLYELNKFYLDAAAHHSGAAAILMKHILEHWRTTDTDLCWLGVSQFNTRAIRFYRKHGFTPSGTRVFQVGPTTNDDFILTQHK
ncbi:Ribosomal protein S18 acetylase RimI [Micrococcales bacterium KH10]|nr:Ribosomal protein S18 acetylase RimI [Micrococcales bacterium KH10]